MAAFIHFRTARIQEFLISIDNLIHDNWSEYGLGYNNLEKQPHANKGDLKRAINQRSTHSIKEIFDILKNAAESYDLTLNKFNVEYEKFDNYYNKVEKIKIRTFNAAILASVTIFASLIFLLLVDFIDCFDGFIISLGSLALNIGLTGITIFISLRLVYFSLIDKVKSS